MNLKDMTDKQLISEYHGLYGSVFILECYSTSDMTDMMAVAAELERRGYTIEDGEPVITKRENDDD